MPPEVKIDPSIDMKTPPKKQADTMSADKYFAYAAEVLKLQPPHLTDQPIIAQLKRIGFEPGKGFDLNAADPAVKKGLESAPADAQALMQWKIPTLARVVNNWSMNYGNYYLKRAMVTQIGLGANLPGDAIYPLNLGDSDGKPLDGANNYAIHFDKDQIPPAQAFWSITLYDLRAFRWPTQSIALRSRAGCPSNTMPTDRSTSISRTRTRARTRRPTGFPLRKVHSI